MKIYLTVLKPSIGTQLLDAWHAYRQHINHYDSGVEYVFNSETGRDAGGISILFDYMGKRVKDSMIRNYDIVIICNGSEPMNVASPQVRNLMSHSNVFFLANSYLYHHELQCKTIWFCADLMNCRDYWTRHFYPQFFDIASLARISRSPSIACIFGARRAHRQFLADVLKPVLSDCDPHTQFDSGLEETPESQWESLEDRSFRLYVNELYDAQPNDRDHYENRYYQQSVSVGINNKFGEIPPGYFILPLYYENSCVVFPETGWQNNELVMTEKSLKCFAAGCLPFPMGGANINRLYNELGFFTAWNLLPETHRRFDGVLDHAERIALAAQAVGWLRNNPEVFVQDQFRTLTQSNKLNFFTCHSARISVLELDRIIRSVGKS